MSGDRRGAPIDGSPRRTFLAAFGLLLGPDPRAARQSLLALFMNSATSLVAGAMLAAITSTFLELPGLLVLVPAAIGLRGNVFSALGNRMSTSIHTGTFRVSLRPRSALGQNVIASLALTAGMSVALALLAKGMAVAFGIENTISIASLSFIAVVGGTLASLVVLGATLGLASGAVRYGWDLDNVVAPVVSTVGDVLTIPALWLAAQAVGHGRASDAASVAITVLAAMAGIWGLATRLETTRTIVRQSVPVLLAAALLSTLAGLAVEQRLELFSSNKVLFVLLPAFVSSVGALGGILASRLATRLHLGTVVARAVPGRPAWTEASLVFLLAFPVALFNGGGAEVVAWLQGSSGPGVAAIVAASVLASIPAMCFVALVAYYSSVASFRVGLDPDTYGIPVVTSSVDFAGAMILIVVIAALGIT